MDRDVKNTAAYRRGVALAKEAMESIDVSATIDRSDQMPCGCHWRAPGHIVVGVIGLSCPKDRDV